MSTHIRLSHAAAIGVWLLISLASAAETAFQAGAAKREITPREPVPMWGYGGRHDARSTGVADPLQAAALVIEAGGQRVAIVGVDLGRGPTESMLARLRKRMQSETGIRHAFFGGSHTHHGPVLELSDVEGRGKGKHDAALRYDAELEDSLVEVLIEASRRLEPARLAVGSVQLEGFNRNRHTKLEPKPVDRELGVLRVDDAGGRPIAVLVNFAAHPTSIPEENLDFSADYPGALKATLEDELGGVAVFMQGAAGDLSTDRGRHGDYRQYGEALGREAAKLALSLTTAAVTNASLQVREEVFQFESRTDFRNPVNVMVYSLAFFPELIANYVAEFGDAIRPRLSVGLLNDEIALVGVSGEFFCQHALRLKERARIRHLFFFGYCNGHHLYFPTIEAVAEGGYGADARVAPVAVGAGERMMDTALTWLYQMRGRIKITDAEDNP
jgi:neutral ceramidase